MKKILGISAAVLCPALIFAGCGGGGGTTPTGTVVSGTVSAPSGVDLGRAAGRSPAAPANPAGTFEIINGKRDVLRRFC